MQRLLPATFSIVGTARKALSHEEYREELHAAVAQHSRTRPLNEEVWHSFAEHLHFVATPDDAGYEELRRTLDQLDFALGTHANRLFYLATPPPAYEPIVKAIGEHRLRGQTGWARIVVEKPFGHDRESARALNEVVHIVFREDEVFRIDHSLGTETVQILNIGILVHEARREGTTVRVRAGYHNACRVETGPCRDRFPELGHGWR